MAPSPELDDLLPSDDVEYDQGVSSTYLHHRPGYSLLLDNKQRSAVYTVFTGKPENGHARKTVPSLLPTWPYVSTHK